MFGPHLMLELYNCNENISKREVIEKFLLELPEIIDMHKISEPIIIEYSGRDGSFDKGGFSGIILIAESHITIHTFNAQKYATIDIFSCKDFDTSKAENYVKDLFKPEKIERNFVMRGKEFPKEISHAIKIIKRQRNKKSL
ncbi:MAG: adenosylmethionine decarboxylase [Candidatus Aenigmatarchaeota archaeon]